MNEILWVNDFFCGAGGMGLGFKQADFRLSGAWDFDKWAIQSYTRNVSAKAKNLDVTEMTKDDVPYADVWTFGFPCQDVSYSGLRKGMVKGETRSGLFYEIMRLLSETEEKDKPKIIIAENVKGIIPYLPTIEEEYAKQGYKLYYTLYNTKYWFLPQNRERYFMIGVHNSIKERFEFPIEQKDFVPKLETICDIEVDEKYYISDEKAERVIKQAMEKLENQTGFEFPDLIKDRGPNMVGMVDLNGHDILKRVYDLEGVSPTLTTSQGGNTQPKILIPITVVNKGNDFKRFSEVSNCLLARDYKGFGNQEMNAIIDGYRVRRLTPREYARLQGFGEDYKQIVSDTQFYKQMGNAVTVNISFGIAKQIRKFLLQANQN